MTQTPARNCTNCGAPLAPGQRFCSNCGSVQDTNINKATEMAPGNSSEQFTPIQTQGSAIPPPPPSLPSYATLPTPQQQYSQYPQNYTPPIQSYQDAAAPTYQSVQPAQPVPAYAKPIKDSSGSVLRQLSCGVLLVILLIVLACGGISYGVYAYIRNAANNAGTSTGYTSTNSTNTGNSTAKPATQIPATTMNIDAAHGTVTYASVQITITDVKQAAAFADDTSSSTNGVLRIDFKEQTPNGNTGIFAYSSVARLLLPDGTSVQPSNAKDPDAPASGTARTNWLDFPVPSTVKGDQVTLLLGVDAEAQIKVPLTGKADLTQYQNKSTTPNKMVTYADLKWTMTNATTSLSSNGTQAQKGMQYVVVTLSIDNPSSNSFIKYYGDYLRLKAGATTSAPSSSSTLPTTFDPGSSGKTGTVIFQVPPGASYSLIFLADQNNKVSQNNIDFQV